MIMMSGDLYHAVGQWTPTVGEEKNGITPGRIGHVHFSAKSTLATLKGKPKGWLVNTMGGLAPDLSLPRNTLRSPEH